MSAVGALNLNKIYRQWYGWKEEPLNDLKTVVRNFIASSPWSTRAISTFDFSNFFQIFEVAKCLQ